MATMFDMTATTSGLDGERYDGELPASPTAALWTASEEEQKYRRRMKKKVSFSSEVKLHDGLTPRHYLFDKLITMYFVEQREVSELDVMAIADSEVSKILDIHEDLVDMISRIEEALADGRQCAPVLPRGGGMCTKLMGAHLPYIRVLDRVVEAAANRAASRKKQSEMQQQI